MFLLAVTKIASFRKVDHSRTGELINSFQIYLTVIFHTKYMILYILTSQNFEVIAGNLSIMPFCSR